MSAHQRRQATRSRLRRTPSVRMRETDVSSMPNRDIRSWFFAGTPMMRAEKPFQVSAEHFHSMTQVPLAISQVVLHR